MFLFSLINLEKRKFCEMHLNIFCNDTPLTRHNVKPISLEFLVVFKKKKPIKNRNTDLLNLTASKVYHHINTFKDTTSQDSDLMFC